MGFDMPALCLICLTWGVGDKTRQEKARKGKKRQEKKRQEKARKEKKRRPMSGNSVKEKPEVGLSLPVNSSHST